MEASGNMMLKDQQIEFNALSGSLSMMSKGKLQLSNIRHSSQEIFQSSMTFWICGYLPLILGSNVIKLYFSNKMDSGKFESASRVRHSVQFQKWRFTKAYSFI